MKFLVVNNIVIIKWFSHKPIVDIFAFKKSFIFSLKNSPFEITGKNSTLEITNRIHLYFFHFPSLSNFKSSVFYKVIRTDNVIKLV